MVKAKGRGRRPKLRYTEESEVDAVRLDLGAGKAQRTPPGFTPVDKHKADGVLVVDLARGAWPWKSSSVDEVRADYVLHYLAAAERVHFMNELYRVLKPDGRATVIVPYWCSQRTFVDIRVQWPPIGEAFFSTLSKAWREAQNWIDDTGLACDFVFTCGYGMLPQLEGRHEDYKRDAAMFYKDAIVDLHVTLTKAGA